MADHTCTTIGKSDGKGVMAIPADMDESPPMVREQRFSLTESEEMEVVEDVQPEEDPIINVRAKGQGKEIRINEDNTSIPFQSIPVYPSTSETVTDKILKQQTGKPFDDIRSARKRKFSPSNLQQVGEKKDATSQPLSVLEDLEFSSPEGIKTTVNTAKQHNIPLKKRKRPDSPMKKYEIRREKLKQTGEKLSHSEHKEYVINEELTLEILKKWLKEGISINGRKFEVRLSPVEEVPPADKSYIKQHGFSPGKDLEGIEEKSFDEDTESLPTFTVEQALPVEVQDSPMDLRYKPLDYSIQDKNNVSIAAKASAENSTVGSTSEVVELVEPEDHDNLPSLTKKTENLNLKSWTFQGSYDKPKAAPEQLLPALAQLLAANQTPTADTDSVTPKPETPAPRQHRYTLPSDPSHQEAPCDSKPAVPNLANLGITTDEGTLRVSEIEKVKEYLRIKIQGGQGQ